MHNEDNEKGIVHHLFWRVQKKAGVSLKKNIGTGRPIGLKLLGIGNSSTRTFHNPSTELKKLFRIIHNYYTRRFAYFKGLVAHGDDGFLNIW